MGLCSSNTAGTGDPVKDKQERAASKEVDKTMKADWQAESQVLKLLLLGAGESGKSTLFKQMMTLYGSGFKEDDLIRYEKIIYNNIITSMQKILGEVPKYSPDLPVANEAAKNKVLGLEGHEIINEDLAGVFKELWMDQALQITFQEGHHYQLTDSAKFFFDRIDAVGAPDYVPAQQDVMRARARTTGIVEEDFSIDDTHFKMFDVGGQRNERKKWIHCFQDVTSVLFVGVLSEYNQMLFEDGETNRMEETLKLYEEIINMRWFADTAMILFLNKRDVFAEKILTHKLTEECPNLFGDYPDSVNNYDEGCAAIRDLFRQKNHKDNGEEEFFCHVTCATDTTNVQAVFEICKDIIINKTLKAAGLV